MSVSSKSKPKSVSIVSKPKSVSIASKPKSVSIVSKPKSVSTESKPGPTLAKSVAESVPIVMKPKAKPVSKSKIKSKVKDKDKPKTKTSTASLAKSKPKFETIMVDQEFNVANGFCGLKRDIIMKLCNLLGFDVKVIRAMIGICGEQYQFKSHPYFLEGRRPKKIPTGFLPNPKSGIEIVHTPTGLQCLFSHNEGHRSLFLDGEISQTGVTHWALRVDHLNVERRTYVNIGIIIADSLNEIKSEDSRIFANSGPPLSMSLCSSRADELGLFLCGYNVMRSYSGWSDSSDDDLEASWYRKYKPDDLRIAAEADTQKRTLSFFVDGVKAPYAFQNVNFKQPLHFGMEVLKPSDPPANGETPVKITPISLTRLPTPTKSQVRPSFYECHADYSCRENERRRRR